MSGLTDWLDVATASWLLLTALYAVRQLMRGRHHSVNFLTIVHFLFCGVPLFLDQTFGRPYYWNMPGYVVPSMDETTDLIYCLYVAAVPLIWYAVGLPRDREARMGEGPFTRGVLNLNVLVYVGLMALPIVSIAFAPEPSLYMEYAASIGDDLDSGIMKYQSLVSALCLVALLATDGFLLRARKIGYMTWVLVAPFLFAIVWLNGKRWIVALAICSLFYVALVRGLLAGRRLIIAGVLAAVAMGTFSHNYQRMVRAQHVNFQSPEELYINIRLDYCRDAVMKFAIYSELHPERGPILEYRGQSLLFNLVCFMPRSMMPDKPWPYSVYVTAAIYGKPADFIGWGVTTSWLEETIANLGWAGMLIGPLALAWLCRVGDSSGDAITHALTILFGCLMLAVQLVAFLPLAMLWCMAVGISLVHRRWGAPAEAPAQPPAPTPARAAAWSLRV